MKIIAKWATVTTLGLLLAVPAAHAGRSCEAKKPSAASVQNGLVLAERTAAALDAEHGKNGTQAVLLARAGQDLSKYGLKWSHLAFAVRQNATVDGKTIPVWRVVHKLNQCGTATASLYKQGLGEFFLDDPWRFETAWVVPTPEVQAKVQALLADSSKVAALHQRRYSIVSYPWAQKYQQSNQWVIETLALAMDADALSRERAQAWLQLKGYQPTTLTIGALTRLGGRVSAANVAFDDHPDSKRFADRIETVTVDSVFVWLQRAGLAGNTSVLRL